MKTLDKIPTGKFERTGSLLKAGAKVGINYVKYLGCELFVQPRACRSVAGKNFA